MVMGDNSIVNLMTTHIAVLECSRSATPASPMTNPDAACPCCCRPVRVPDVGHLEVGNSVIATTGGPIEIRARFEPRNTGPFLRVHMPNASTDTLMAVRRGACAALWCISDVMKRCGVKNVHLPLPLSHCFQHCSLHMSLCFPVLDATGSSIGLAAALSVVSLCMGWPCNNVAATGRVSFTL